MLAPFLQNKMKSLFDLNHWLTNLWQKNFNRLKFYAKYEVFVTHTLTKTARTKNIVAAFRGMHVSPAKHSYA